MTLEFAWGDWEVQSTLDAPGWLSLSVNGKEISKCDKWDYSLGGCGDSIGPNDGRLKDLHLRQGDRVTLTVAPRRAMHAWQVWLVPA